MLNGASDGIGQLLYNDLLFENYKNDKTQVAFLNNYLWLQYLVKFSQHFFSSDTFRMRRSSFSRFGSVGKQEPLIVVEESQLVEEEDRDSSETPSNKASLDIDSPVNPYLLSPWRDPREGRKHSLPSQQVTEGITASQVRRLSERGGEGSGPSPKEAAFLATLSQAPAPSGRRHSVVTISKVPTTLFGRSRRESVAAYPAGSR